MLRCELRDGAVDVGQLDIVVCEAEMIRLTMTADESEGPLEHNAKGLVLVEVVLEVVRGGDHRYVDGVLASCLCGHPYHLLHLPQTQLRLAFPTRSCDIAWGVRTGLVIRADDDVTGFGGGKIGRPYLVIRVLGDPPELIYVVPRSASGWEGVPVPEKIVPGLNKPGNFLTDPLPVPVADLIEAEILGELPEPYLSRVLERIQTFYMELDE